MIIIFCYPFYSWLFYPIWNAHFSCYNPLTEQQDWISTGDLCFACQDNCLFYHWTWAADITKPIHSWPVQSSMRRKSPIQFLTLTLQECKSQCSVPCGSPDRFCNLAWVRFEQCLHDLHSTPSRSAFTRWASVDLCYCFFVRNNNCFVICWYYFFCLNWNIYCGCYFIFNSLHSPFIGYMDITQAP